MGGHRESPAGTLLNGRYRLIEPLASGGMGTVWRGHDELLDRPVAVKELLLPPGLDRAEQDLLRQRTIREAQAAARLRHPGVIVVYDVVEQSDRPWIVMELVKSRSLAQVLSEDGPLPPADAANIGLRVLAALTIAHSAGVLHRDVKPGNVLLADDGRVVLTDFGIARLVGDATLTTAGLLIGSPAYISPERARGQPPGPPADLWSLGAMLYTAVEGVPPFQREGPLPTLTAVLDEEPPLAARAGPLWPVIHGLLVKDPARRLTARAAQIMLKRVATEGRHGRPPAGAAPSGDVSASIFPLVSAGPTMPALPTAALPPTDHRLRHPSDDGTGNLGLTRPIEMEPPAAGTPPAAQKPATAPETAAPTAPAPRAPTPTAGRKPPAAEKPPSTAEPATTSEPAATPEAPHLVPPDRVAEPTAATATPPTGDRKPPAAEERPAGKLPPGAAEPAAAGPVARGQPAAEVGRAVAASPAAQKPPSLAGQASAGPAATAAAPGPPDTRPADQAAGPTATPTAPAASAKQPATKAERARAVPTSSPAEPRSGRPRSDWARSGAGAPATVSREPGPPGPGRRRSLRWLAAILGVAAVVAATVVTLANRNDGGTGQAAPSSSPTASVTSPRGGGTQPAPTRAPSTAPSTAPKSGPTSAPPGDGGAGQSVPPGFVRYQDRTGFSVAIPAGWQPVHNGPRVDFHEPDGGRFLRVDQTDSPKGDPVADWQRQETGVSARLPGYRLVRPIARVDYRGWDAADWEFTWTSGGTTIHVLNRSFVTSPTKAYALYWSVPDSQWASSRRIFDIAAGTFQPAT